MDTDCARTLQDPSGLPQARPTSCPARTRLILIYVRSDTGKENTRACARKAGMGDSVSINPEPEADIIHSLHVIAPESIEDGDKFVCLDAGGGMCPDFSVYNEI